MLVDDSNHKPQSSLLLLSTLDPALKSIGPKKEEILPIPPNTCYFYFHHLVVCLTMTRSVLEGNKPLHFKSVWTYFKGERTLCGPYLFQIT